MLKEVLFCAVLMLAISCSKDECTKTQTLYGGYGPYGPLPDKTIEVPCDFPDPAPIGEL